MPVGRRKQSNAMLYTLITFIGLFVVATTFAVIFYVESEKYRTQNATLQAQTDELASSRERQALGSIVGQKPTRRSWLAQMVDYLDQTVSLVVGGAPESTSVQVKVANAKQAVRNTVQLVQEHRNIADADPNTVGLVRVVQQLKAELDDTIKAQVALKKQYDDLQARFDDARVANLEKEQELSEKIEQYRQALLAKEQEYEELKALTKKTSDERAQTLMAQLDEERANIVKLNQELANIRSELETTQDMLKRAQAEVDKIKGAPDHEVAVLEPDGKVILVDEPAGAVQLNIGSDHHVYRGLSLAVFDKNAPIPKDGKGKAEVEVFAIAKNISAARIINLDKRNPIAVDDVVVNLIWDSQKTNVVVVAGEFDLDADGDVDYDAVDKIKALIAKWGAKVADAVSADTDFLILGNAPHVPPKPTFDDLEVDPLANEKYQAAMQRLNRYNAVQSRAEALWIPTFTYERFLYLIGYKGQADKPGAF